MPPAISDDELESDWPDDIPAKADVLLKDEEVAEEDDEEDDDDEEEYRVEKILAHGFAEDGSAVYQIKWLGYDKKSDLTWEPTENLTNAVDILKEYHKKIGGPPKSSEKKKKGGKGGKRSASAAFPESPAVQSSGKKGRKNPANGATGREWTPPDGLWEDHVTRVSSIIEETDAEFRGGKGTNDKGLYGLLEWNDGHKTQFPLDVVRRKCPQRLLDYYEQHLVFKSGGGAEADEE